MVLITNNIFSYWFEVNKENSSVPHIFIRIAFYWMKLRCISYYSDEIDCCKEGKPRKSFITALSYCLYLPFLFTGPFVTFKDFEKCVNYCEIDCMKRNYRDGNAESNETNKVNSRVEIKKEKIIDENREIKNNNVLIRLKSFSINILRFTFWLLVYEIMLHFFYANLLSYYPDTVKTLNNWKLYGFGYCISQFFHVKYVIIYGFTTSIAKLDNVIVPNVPKCIGRIHVYSDMWRYFDAGLYKFMVKYIYKPTLLINSILNKLLSSFLCFAFIYLWHGMYTFTFVWTFLNFIGITTEVLSYNVYKKYLQKSLENNFSLQWLRRMFCLAASPLLAMSAISNFYFFTGLEVGNVFLHRFLGGNF